MIFNMIGGGAAFNFKIVGGTTKPENPSKNTIWVNTDAEITGWVFIGSKPAPSGYEPPVEGQVWIVTGSESGIGFNALKKNAIYLQPLSAWQVINGSRVEKVAQIYQGGSWHDFIDWSKWIVKDGLTNFSIKGVGKGHDPSYSHTSYTISKKDGYIQIKSTAGTGMVYFGPVDLTNADKLKIEGSFDLNDHETFHNLCVWSKIGTYTTSNREKYKQLTTTGATLGVSDLTGEYYVGITTRNTATQKITNFWRE